MSTRFALLFISIFVFLTGCATVTGKLSKTAEVDENSAYLAGWYYGEGYAYAFKIKNVDTDKESSLSFDTGPLFAEPKEGEFILYPVKPGKYQMIRWQRIDKLVRTTHGKAILPKLTLYKPFEVKVGQVHFLGKFKLWKEHKLVYKSYQEVLGITPEKVLLEDANQRKNQVYPNFVDLPTVCIFEDCID